MAIEIKITECLVDFIGVYSPLDRSSVKKEGLINLIGKPVHVQSGWMNEYGIDQGKWFMIFREEMSPQRDFLFACEDDFLYLKRIPNSKQPIRMKSIKTSREN